MRRRWNLVLALALKDWQLFLADRRAAALAFLVPIVLASAFGLIFARPNSASSESVQLPVLIVIEDDGPFTKLIAEEFAGSARVESEFCTRAEAEKRIAERRPGVAVIFPKGFEQLAEWKPGRNSERPSVEIRYNPLCRSEGQWAEGLVSEVVMRKLAGEKFGPVLGESGFQMPFQVKATESGAAPEGFNSYSHSFSGMTLQYLLFWGMESGLALLRDRQRSVWSRLRAAPVSLGSLLLGKAISTASIAFLIVLTTFAFGYFAFGVRIGGSLLGFGLLALAASGLAAATGLLVAAVGGTEARARSVSILVILGVSMLGGLWLPSFVLPAWARDAALSLPTTWAMRGLDGVTWQGSSLWATLPHIGAVAGFAAVFLAFAVVRLITSEARRRRGLK